MISYVVCKIVHKIIADKFQTSIQFNFYNLWSIIISNVTLYLQVEICIYLYAYLSIYLWLIHFGSCDIRRWLWANIQFHLFIERNNKNSINHSDIYIQCTRLNYTTGICCFSSQLENIVNYTNKDTIKFILIIIIINSYRIRNMNPFW